MKRGPFEENNFEKKSHNAKKTKGDPLVLPGPVRYAEKQEKPSWFSWLGEMVQFDTMKFRRTFEKLFRSLRVD